MMKFLLMEWIMLHLHNDLSILVHISDYFVNDLIELCQTDCVELSHVLIETPCIEAYS